jgi:endonuclease/exonuclease/phosphatase family metal-dependent hydrolase
MLTRKTLVKRLLTALGYVCLLLFVILAVLFLLNMRIGIATNTGRHSDVTATITTPLTLRVITFNAYNLYIDIDDKKFAPRDVRIRELGRKAAEANPDLAGFQEVFIEKDRQILIQELRKSRLQYFQYYPAGLVGSGMLIASAYPIEKIGFLKYSTAGPWYRLHEGEFWAGKGAALAQIALPAGGRICFYDTHLSGKNHPDIQGVQISELVDYIKQTCPVDVAAIAIGDYNVCYNDPPFAALANISKHMHFRQDNDTIITLDNHIYTFELEKASLIEKTSRQGDLEFDVSDHDGVLAVIRILKK